MILLSSWIYTSSPLYTHWMRILSSCTNPPIAFFFLPLAQGPLRSGYASIRRPIYFQLPYTIIVIFLTPFMFIIPIVDTMIDDTSHAITPHYIESFNEITNKDTLGI